MRDQSLTKLASRSAAVFLIGWAAQMFGGVWIDALNGARMTTTQAVGWALVCCAMGVVVLVLPWERWPPLATFAIAFAIVPLLAGVAWTTQFAAGKDTPNPDSAFFIILAWVGVTQRRWSPLIFAPYIGVIYGGVLALTPGTRESMTSMPTVIFLAAGLGLVISWMMETVTRAQLVERQRLNDVETLTGMLSTLRGVPIEDAAELIAHAAIRVHRCSAVAVVLRGGETDPAFTTFRTGARVSRPEAADLLARADPSIAGRVRIDPVDPGPSSGTDSRWRLSITLVTPRDEVAGIVIVDLDVPPDPFALHLSRLFATEIGTAVEQVEQVEVLEQRALFDELTGVGNRRWAIELLNALEPGDAVMLVDIDDFKRVNDTKGHATGDEVLRALGHHMRGAVEDTESMARYGGDEFLVVNKADKGDPLTVANRIHQGWLGRKPEATISIGVAVHPSDSLAAVTLEHADEALYNSKQHGRNKVILYQDQVPSGGD